MWRKKLQMNPGPVSFWTIPMALPDPVHFTGPPYAKARCLHAEVWLGRYGMCQAVTSWEFCCNVTHQSAKRAAGAAPWTHSGKSSSRKQQKISVTAMFWTWFKCAPEWYQSQGPINSTALTLPVSLTLRQAGSEKKTILIRKNFSSLMWNEKRKTNRKKSAFFNVQKCTSRNKGQSHIITQVYTAT